MRITTTIGVLAAGLAGLALFGTPSYAAPRQSHRMSVSHDLTYRSTVSPGPTHLDPAAPHDVQNKVADIQANGGRILSISHADYRQRGSAEGSVALAGFPSGCGLWVVVYHSGDYVTNSSLTSCTFATQATEMYGGLARSRWYGWEQEADGDAYNEGHASLSLDINYYCKGTGTHDYQGVTNGELIRGGKTYTASAWDQTDNVHC